MASSPWAGSAANRHWSNYREGVPVARGAFHAAGALRALVSCRSDFAVSQLPGWHTDDFPPYFVAGAIFSGFGMVLTLLIPDPDPVQARGGDHDAAHRTDGQK